MTVVEWVRFPHPLPRITFCINNSFKGYCMKRADQREFHYIYQITRDDGKFYIGMHSTDNLEDGYFGSGKLITRSIKKHGLARHSKQILEFLPTREALRIREKEIVCNELLGDARCMNLMLGGSGGWDHIPRETVLKNLSKGNKGWDTYNKSDLARQRSRANAKKLNESGTVRHDIFKGKSHTAEVKQKIGAKNSLHQSGSNNSQFGTCWVIKDNKPQKIKIEDLEKYQEEGFKRGRK